MVEDDLGEINYLNVGHQSLEEIDPDLSLSAMLLWKDHFEYRISDVTLFLILPNLDPKWDEFIVVVIYGGSEGLIVTTRLEIHSLAMCNILLVR